MGDTYNWQEALIDEIERFAPPDEVKNIDFSILLHLFEKMGVVTITQDIMFIGDLKWRAPDTFVVNIKTTLSKAIAKGLPIIDFILALNLIEQGKMETVTFVKDGSMKNHKRELVAYVKAIGLFILNLITRNDPTPGDKYEPPMIAKTVFDIENAAQYQWYISVNQLNKLNFDWILDCSWYYFPVIVKERVRMGIAGSRFARAITLYEHKKFLEDPELRAIILIKKVVSKGLFLEYHPRKNPRKDLNLSRNLQVLILKSFDKEVINKMVADKRLAKYPVVTDFIPTYSSWTESTFDYLVTSISSKLDDEPLEESESNTGKSEKSG